MRGVLPQVFIIRVLELCGLVLLIVFVALTWRRASGTTLTHVRGWALSALVALALATLYPTEARRFAAWSLTFCPALSLLGAKRPQHVAWNFVVFSLWGVLILPLVESLTRGPAAAIDLGGLRPWFLVGLILLNAVSYFATRYAFAGFLLAAAQAAFFGRYLPFAEYGFSYPWYLTSYWLLFAAAAWAEWQFRRSRPGDLHPLDVVWLDFRDSFGLFWSLRVAERVNAAAVQAERPERLEWEGFVVPAEVPLAKTLDAALASGLRTTLRGLLRRFVDHGWLERRGVADNREFE